MLQRRLHGVALGLGLIGHARQVAQAGRHFVTLQFSRSIGAGIALSHDADLDARALRHFTRLTDNGLQLVDKLVNRGRHIANLVAAVDGHAFGQVTLTRRQIVERSDQQTQLVDYPPPQHHRHHQQHAEPDQRQAYADIPA
ncbi:hypothetical protein D3C76_1040760 [compost metagenome]